MEVVESAVSDAYVITPTQHRDDRGTFLEWYRFERLEEIRGYSLDLRQANCSVSDVGVLRGIHAAAVPPGQAKYVTCIHGTVLDVVVDIRVGSPTFGKWDAIRLDDVDRRAFYLSEGLGHAFVALSDNTTVIYLCSEVYSPSREFGIHPLDPGLGINWPANVTPLLSPKDESAPTLDEAAKAGLLPRYEDCLTHYAALRSASKA
ncbi:MAG TPA: dTDP-4-dehydrorhamnose 3,5-epimerase [Jiangellaceae bacterium]